MINLSPHLINLRAAKSTERVIWLRQDPSAACAASEASDMTVALQKTHIHTETHKRIQEIHRNTQGTQKYTETYALFCHKSKIQVQLVR